MELTVEEIMLIINALNVEYNVFLRYSSDIDKKNKVESIIKKLQKQKVGKTKIVRIKK